MLAAAPPAASPRPGHHTEPHAWPAVLDLLLAGTELPAASARWAMTEVVTGAATAAQVAGFAVALRAKGETAAEIASLVDTLLEHGLPLDVPAAVGPVVDTCGTGGDRLSTVNISTMTAVLVAACGVPVVKHGNRAASSASGSADVLEALGVAVDLGPERVARCLSEVGIGFCFAPLFHPALRFAAPARRELGVATVFNVLGPLANPARPAAQVVGVASLALAPVLAAALARRGVSALVVRGREGLDEVSVSGPTQVWEVLGHGVREHLLEPAAIGVASFPLTDLRGGTPAENAAVARAVLQGWDGAPGSGDPLSGSGPERAAPLLAAAEAVVANAAAALVAHAGALAPPAEPLVDRLQQAALRARGVLASGAALELLDRWVQVSQELAA